MEGSLYGAIGDATDPRQTDRVSEQTYRSMYKAVDRPLNVSELKLEAFLVV